MRGNEKLSSHAQRYLNQHQKLSFSIITQYEILRGLNAKRASRQIDSFLRLCNLSIVRPLSGRVVIRAAEIFGALRSSGQLVSDADILIAATAIEKNLTLVTNNQSHFSRIPDIDLMNWTEH